MPLCRITERPLDFNELVTAVQGPTRGGLATFIGTVRNHNAGTTVVRIDYEAYASMALKVMERIAVDIEAALPETLVAAAHRTGTVHVGEAAVMIAVAAPHRAEAFEGCRTYIERLKKEVPIWKKEFSSDGHTWVSPNP